MLKRALVLLMGIGLLLAVCQQPCEAGGRWNLHLGPGGSLNGSIATKNGDFFSWFSPGDPFWAQRYYQPPHSAAVRVPAAANGLGEMLSLWVSMAMVLEN